MGSEHLCAKQERSRFCFFDGQMRYDLAHAENDPKRFGVLQDALACRFDGGMDDADGHFTNSQRHVLAH